MAKYILLWSIVSFCAGVYFNFSINEYVEKYGPGPAIISYGLCILLLIIWGILKV